MRPRYSGGSQADGNSPYDEAWGNLTAELVGSTIWRSTPVAVDVARAARASRRTHEPDAAGRSAAWI